MCHIPSEWDIRPVISHRKATCRCFRKASNVPQAVYFSASLKCLAFLWDITGLTSAWNYRQGCAYHLQEVGSLCAKATSGYSQKTPCECAHRPSVSRNFKQQHGGGGLTVGQSGFLVCGSHPFLGATPDGMVYNPTDPLQPFGFLEIKCPYSQKDVHPITACSLPGLCCKL